MAANRKPYPVGHWLRSCDPALALSAYLEQQSQAYSRVKNDFIAELMGDFQGRSFLDYGCGAGMFLVQAARRGASFIVGVDAESPVLATARYFLQQEGLADNCHLLVSEKFPSARLHRRFDLILLKDVLEHVADDQSLLNNAAAFLAPGGCLILSTQNAISLNYLTQGNYHRIWRGDKHWFGWDPTHLRFYSPVSLRRQLLRAGLRPVAWRSAYIVPYKFPAPKSSPKQFIRFDRLSWLDRMLGRMWPFNQLGWNIIVKAVR